MNSSYVYCVFDQVANSYSPVFESKNDQTAMRDVFRSLGEKVDLDLFCGDNQLLCVAKLEKTNNDDFSEYVVKLVSDNNRVVDWVLPFGKSGNQEVKDEE